MISPVSSHPPSGEGGVVLPKEIEDRIKRIVGFINLDLPTATLKEFANFKRDYNITFLKDEKDFYKAFPKETAEANLKAIAKEQFAKMTVSKPPLPEAGESLASSVRRAGVDSTPSATGGRTFVELINSLISVLKRLFTSTPSSQSLQELRTKLSNLTRSIEPTPALKTLSDELDPLLQQIDNLPNLKSSEVKDKRKEIAAALATFCKALSSELIEQMIVKTRSEIENATLSTAQKKKLVDRFNDDTAIIQTKLKEAETSGRAENFLNALEFARKTLIDHEHPELS